MKKLLCLFITLFSVSLFAQDYVLLHGWMGNGDDWNNSGVENLIQSQYHSNIYKPSLNGTSSAYVQSLNLRNFLNNNNVNNGVAVSFSMGGMTNRYHLRRQYDNLQNSRISQHYSILSPHLGSKAADNVPKATRLLFVGAYAAVWPGWIEDNGSSSYIVHHDFTPAFEMVILLLGPTMFDAILNHVAQPALNDLKTNSSAVQYINPTWGNYYENNLLKVAIVGMEIDPVVWRLTAGFMGEQESTVIQLVETVNNWKFANMVNALLGFLENQVSLSTLAGYIASYVFVLNIDWIWQNKIVESTESDGIVSRNNQIYPNATRLYFPQEVSHMEGRNHQNVILSLADAFEDFAPIPSLSVNISGPTILGYKEKGTYTANASGGSGAFSYEWRYRYNGQGSWSGVVGTQKTYIRSMLNTDIELQVKVTSGSFTEYDTFYINYLIEGILSKSTSGSSAIPESVELHTNYPNPFNPSTTIKFGLPENQTVKLSIYTVDGRLIRTLINKPLSAGYHTVEWDGHNSAGAQAASGIYVYELSVSDQRYIKKMHLIQ